MAKPSNPLEFPVPASAWTGNRFFIAAARSLSAIAKLWRPNGSTLGNDGCTLSLVALRVVDRETGVPYSADELVARVTADTAAAIAALPASEGTFDGEPVNYVAEVAATAMSETYTVDSDKTVTLTAKTLGVLSPAPKLVVTAPDALPAGANATLAIVSQAAGVVTVRPKTGPGDKATSTIAASGDDIVMRSKTAGPDGSLIEIDVALATTDCGLLDESNDPIPFPTPGVAALSCAKSGSTYTITPISGAGTPGVLTLTESGGSEGVITITQKAAYVGAWGNAKVHATIGYGTGNSTALSVAISYDTTLNIAITLGTDAEGLTLPVTEADLVTAINGELLTIGWDDVLLAAAGGGALGSFNTSQAQVSMADGVDAALDTTPIAVADFELLLTGASGSDLEVATVGTGNWVPAITTYTFSGGGANSSIVTTLAELTTLLHDAPSTIIDCTAGAGLQTTVIEATAGVTLTGGSNVVPAVPGTPGRLGRLATDGTDVWTALVENQTTTQAGWVKTFTGGA